MPYSTRVRVSWDYHSTEKYTPAQRNGPGVPSLNESILNQMPGSLAVGHTRYSTTGSSRVVNAQPAVLEPVGTFGAHNGNLVNTSNLREVAKSPVTTTTTDSELNLRLQKLTQALNGWKELFVLFSAAKEPLVW